MVDNQTNVHVRLIDFHNQRGSGYTEDHLTIIYVYKILVCIFDDIQNYVWQIDNHWSCIGLYRQKFNMHEHKHHFEVDFRWLKLTVMEAINWSKRSTLKYVRQLYQLTLNCYYNDVLYVRTS